MRNSKQIGKILFLWLLFTWFRATADRWVFTKFPTCVIDTFCVWLKMDKKWLLVRCIKLRKVTIAFVMSICPSVHIEQQRLYWMCALWIFLWERPIVKTQSKQRMPVIDIYCCFVCVICNKQEDKRCKYNVIFMRVHVTIVVKKQ